MSANSALDDLRNRIRIGEYAISLAEGAWQDRRAALEAGLKSPNSDSAISVVKHRDRYLSIARYCDEAREILSRYKSDQTVGDTNTTDAAFVPSEYSSPKIIAIDPHIITLYSEFWEENAHAGFEFLDKEFLNREELNNYRLFVYASLLRGSKLVLLDAAKPDIAKMVSFFFEERREKSGPAPITAAELLKEVEHTAFASEFSRTLTGRLEFIHKKALELVSLRAGAAGRQKFALARLNHVLRTGRFYLPEALVRDSFGSDIQPEDNAKLVRFAELVRATRTSSAFGNDSHAALTRAYDRYKKSTDFFSDKDGSKRPQLTRGGELNDLGIIHELHVLNHCLRLCDIDAEIVYATLSTRMYGFLSGFDKNDILAPIIHPRTALVYQENKLARDQRNALETALANPIAFGGGIAKDAVVRPKEIDVFSDRMQNALKATRETFSYSVVAGTDGVDHFLRAFEEIFNKDKDETVKKKYHAVLANVRDKLGQIAPKIGEAYSGAVYDISEEAFDSYQQYSYSALPNQYVAIRKYSVDENTCRFSAIPVTRSYRHMFFLHNSFLRKALASDIGADTVLISVHDLLQRVKKETKHEFDRTRPGTLENAKAFAARDFVRACYAACSGEWVLVQSMANSGLRKLLKSLPAEPSSVTDLTQARGYLLAQELHFLRHLAERATAESSASAGAHGSRLARAAHALRQSSQVSATLPNEFSAFNTPFSPTSIRDALAAVGLLIEWSMKGTWRQITSHDRNFGPILVPTDDAKIAWFGLGLLTDELTHDHEENPIKLVEAAEEVLQRTQSCLDAVEADQAEGHSVEMWRYLTLRAHAMVMTARQAKDVLGDTVYAGLPKEVVEVIRNQRDDHDRFIAGLEILRESDEIKPSKIGINNPFLNGLLAIEAFVVAAPELDGERYISNLPDALRAFADLDEYCSQLYRFGFPRMFLRKAKQELVVPIIENLRATFRPDDSTPPPWTDLTA